MSSTLIVGTVFFPWRIPATGCWISFSRNTVSEIFGTRQCPVCLWQNRWGSLPEGTLLAGVPMDSVSLADDHKVYPTYHPASHSFDSTLCLVVTTRLDFPENRFLQIMLPQLLLFFLPGLLHMSCLIMHNLLHRPSFQSRQSLYLPRLSLKENHCCHHTDKGWPWACQKKQLFDP